MLEKINIKGIVMSFYIGIFIGISLELAFGNSENSSIFLLSVLCSGGIGLVIGGITEVLTSLLPISMAKATRYYFINNMIAVIVAVVILGGRIVYFDTAITSQEAIKMMLFICVIITGANGLDYLCYKRTNRKLQRYKKYLNNRD